tara:strand:- start:2312 stop:3832 length:1521 start_codon:yes stop_codon:yes gene_type:complete
MEECLTQIKGIASTYQTNEIFILGKGPSIDLIDPEVFKNSMVITLNDAERIYPSEISIFHGEWVKKSIANQGINSSLYITSTDFDASNFSKISTSIRRPYISLNNDNGDLMIQRLLGNEIVIEDILFLTALQISRQIALLKKVKQKVYMVGFDFSPLDGQSKKIDISYENVHENKRNLIIGMQENYFLNALYTFKNSEIDIFHIGERSYSRMNKQELEQNFIAQNNLIKKNWSVEIVAELTTNHFGDRNRLTKLVRSAKAAGADFVKVQARNVETFYSQEKLNAKYKSPFGETFRDYRKQLELSKKDFQYLDELCKKLNIKWFASALDQISYEFLVNTNCYAIKLPSTISEYKDYLLYVANNCQKPIVISTGMTDFNYEKWVLKNFSNCQKLYLLQCSSAYPTPMEACNVSVVKHYADISKEYHHIIPGYSSHDDGWFGSTLAVASGAKMIEKHVKMGVTEWAHFDAVALDLSTNEFINYVEKIRESEIILGNQLKQINHFEHHKY